MPPARAMSSDAISSLTRSCLTKGPTYSRLDTEKLQIRLLTLLPDSLGAPLQCELNVRTLGDLSKHEEGIYQWSTGKTFTHDEFPKSFTGKVDWVPRYESLSYTWGQLDGEEHYVSLNGEDFNVTPNLELALQALRKPNEPRTMWIDAICINQDDLQERSEQVQIMANIYQRAHTTIVWLGPEDERSDHPIRLIQGLGGTRAQNDAFWTSPFPIPPRKWVGPVHDFFYGVQAEDVAAEKTFRDYLASLNLMRLNQLSDDDWTVLTNFFQRDYWRRVWVIQEIGNAQQVDVLCGSTWFAWESVNSMISNPGVRLAASVLKGRFADVIKLGVDGLAEQRRFTRHGIRHALLEETDNTLFNLHLRFRAYRSTDPRDKIYALLGLPGVDKDMKLPRPDYTKSVREVYCEFFEAMIKGSASLDVLCLLGLDNLSIPHDLTSWAPNLSNPCVPDAPLLPVSNPEFKAAKDSVPEGPNIKCTSDEFHRILRLPPKRQPFAISRNRSDWQNANGMVRRPFYIPQEVHTGKLALHGYLLDMVKVAGPHIAVKARPPTDEEIVKFVQDSETLFLRDWNRSGTIIDFTNPWPQWTPEHSDLVLRALLSFLTTLLHNGVDIDSNAVTEYEWPIQYFLVQYLTWSGRLNEQELHSLGTTNSLYSLLDNFRKLLPGWRSCVTHYSTYALLPHSAEENDWIVILNGGDVPFVVRQLSPASPEFYLVGPCLVPYCMYGDMFIEAQQTSPKLVFKFV